MRVLALIANYACSIILTLGAISLLNDGMRFVFASLPFPTNYIILFSIVFVVSYLIIAGVRSKWRFSFSRQALLDSGKLLLLFVALLLYVSAIDHWLLPEPTLDPLGTTILGIAVLTAIILLSNGRLTFPFFCWGRQRALRSLISRGDLSAVEKYLQDHPEEIETTLSDGETPLSLAVARGQVDVVGVLLQHGADPNQPNALGMVPLVSSLMHFNPDIASLLIKHGADIHKPHSVWGTPLHAAAAGRLPRVARYLIEHGADVNARNDAGLTPLHMSAVVGDQETVRLLLEHGADINATTPAGDTPLALSRKRPGDLPASRMLWLFVGGRRRVAAFLRHKGAV